MNRAPPPSAPPALHARRASTAPVAQLDRASVFGTEGSEFEPLRPRHFLSPIPRRPRKLSTCRTGLVDRRRTLADSLRRRLLDRQTRRVLLEPDGVTLDIGGVRLRHVEFGAREHAIREVVA